VQDRRYTAFKIPCERDPRTGELRPGSREKMAVAAFTIGKFTLEGGVYCYNYGTPRTVALTLWRPPDSRAQRSAFAENERLHLLLCTEVPEAIRVKSVETAVDAGRPRGRSRVRW